MLRDVKGFRDFSHTHYQYISIGPGGGNESQSLGIQSPCHSSARYLGSMKPFSEGEPGSLGNLNTLNKNDLIFCIFLEIVQTLKPYILLRSISSFTQSTGEKPVVIEVGN